MEINDRVHQEIEEGQLIGPGHFTLSLELMLDKLASFRDKEPLAWLGRLVQAAVASQANRLTITGRYEFYFEPAEECSINELERLLLNPQERTACWLEHLRGALWCLGWSEQGSFSVQLRGNLEQLTCRGGTFTRHPVTSPATVLRVELLPKPEKTHWRKMLEYCAHCSPIPVLLGTRRLDTLVVLAEEPMGIGCSPGLHLPILQIPSGSALGSQAFYRLALPARQSGSVLWILNRRGGSVLRWVDSGVVVDTEELSADLSKQALSIVAYVSAEGLARDASGLKPLHDQSRRERKISALRALKGEIKGVKLAYNRHESFQLSPLGTGLATAGVTTFLGLLLGDLVLGGVVSVFTGALGWAYGHAGLLDIKPDPLRQRRAKDEEDLVRLRDILETLP